MSRRAGSVVRTIARIAIVAVGIGIASWVLVSSVMNGFNETIRVRHLSTEPHVLVEIKNPKKIKVSEDKIKAILKTHDIALESMDGASAQDVIVRTYDGLFGGGVLKGLTPLAFKDFYERTRRAGLVGKISDTDSLPELSEDTWKLDKDEVVMGLDLARTLGVYEGELIVIMPPETLLLPKSEAPPYVQLKIKSLLSTRLPDVDSQWIFYNRESNIAALSQVVSRRENLELRLKDPFQDELVKGLLEKENFKISTWRERNKALFFALRLEKWAMSLFLGLSTLITCFAIISVLLLLIHQKRQEIGILMAMGLSQKKLKQIFVGIGLFLSLIGMGGGLVFGLTTSYLIDRYPVEVLPDIYYDATIPASIEPVQIVGIFFFAVALALFASWFPVRWSLKDSPSACLRKR